MEFRKVGVVGAGVIGAGVAQNLGQVGLDVILVDNLSEALEQARRKIADGLRMRKLFSKGELAASDRDALKSIHCTSDLGELECVDYVIENVTESWKIKQRLYREMDKICANSCTFAVNTSTIPITRVASVTQRPARVIGVHFMNPVPLKPTVEVVRGHHTSEETIAATRQLLTRMGKKSVLVNDSPGFVCNRVLMLTINEAVRLVHECVASPADIDQLFRECFGHSMGPLETADLIGLDTVLSSLTALHDSLGEVKFAPCSLLSKMVDAGKRGRKNNEGFYSYDVTCGQAIEASEV